MVNLIWNIEMRPSKMRMRNGMMVTNHTTQVMTTAAVKMTALIYLTLGELKH